MSQETQAVVDLDGESRFNKWLVQAIALQPEIALINQNILKSAFYTGAAYGSDKSRDIVMGLLKNKGGKR